MPRLLRDWAGRRVKALSRTNEETFEIGKGVHFVTEQEKLMADKAPESGFYELGGNLFKIRKGDVLPNGAAFIKASERNESRKQDKAPENRKAHPPAQTRKSKDKKDD